MDPEDSLERVGGDRELLRELAAVFLADLPNKLAAIEGAVTSGDVESLRREAHSLKGAVSTFGAEPARLAALALEELGKGGELAGVDGMVERLRREVARLEEALGKL